MMKFRLILLSLCLICFLACNRKPADSANTEDSLRKYHSLPKSLQQEGGVRMIPVKTASGTFRVWTRQTGNNPRIRVLLLHGGPALTHEYMECFHQFLPAEGFEIIEYDQLGSAYSDQPSDSSLWTLERFTEELEQVRIALGLDTSNAYLLGNSWGGILGMEYALRYPGRIKALIVSNMTADYTRYGNYNRKLREAMRPGLIDSLERFEKAGQFSDPLYQELVFNEYYCKHILRRPRQEWPEPVLRSFRHINQPVYEILQGPSEFVPGGRLLGWSCWDRLKTLDIPVLMIGARYDTMDPDEMKAMSELAPKGRFLYCPSGSHLSMWDAQEEYYPGIIQFIRDVDEGKFK